MDILKTLQEIEDKVIDLTVIWDLKEVKEFELLENNANYILDEALELLQAQNITIQQKQILIFALQNANFSKYKKFLNDLSILYVDGLVDEFIMYYCIIPNEWSYTVRNNYKDVEIKEILKRCLQYENSTTEFKNRIRRTLAGKDKKK